MIPFRYGGYKLFYDFDKRFSGISAEPSFMGFSLGVISLILLSKKNKVETKKGIFLAIILLIFNRAKMAIIAFPLSLIVAFCLLRLKCHKNVVSFGILLLSLINLIYIYLLINYFFSPDLVSLLDQESSGTYVTRFGILHISLLQMLKNPLGSGFSGYYNLIDESFRIVINRFKYSNTSELLFYLNNDLGKLNPKESITNLNFTFGVFGIPLFSYFFLYLLIRSINIRNIYFISLVVFVFISAFFYIDFISNFTFCFAIGYILKELKIHDK